MVLKPPEFFMKNVKRYSKYQIGDWTYGEPEVLSWGEDTSLIIGRFCSIAKGVKIFLGGEHRVDWVTTYPFTAIMDEASAFKGHPASKGNVVIGNDVWVGRDAVILSGVEIGDGSVIGANSVVTKNVLPYSIVAGNPARIVRFRFKDCLIEDLLEIRWWDWDIEKIIEALPLILSPDIELFITKYKY